MPFVGTERGGRLYRKEIQPEKVGDLCAIAYTPIIRAWRESPRWTTVHKVIKPMLEEIQEDISIRIREMHTNGTGKQFSKHQDAKYATELAYEVFFGLYVLDYEIKKRQENGDIK